MTDILDIYVISDSTGETAEVYLKSLLAQFPDLKYRRHYVSEVHTRESIDNIFSTMPDKSLVLATVADGGRSKYLSQKCKERNIELIDILNPALEKIERLTGLTAKRQDGLIRKQSDEYFSMIEAVEFAIQYDDGKDPRGLLQADIVLVGVSRTSKTPTSMILATKNYKVANLPLVPEIGLPEEIYEVDPERIVGLIINPKKLHSLREDRSKILGLSEGANYSQDDRIEKELAYAKEVFKELECMVIDVTELTVQQTVSKIISYYDQEIGDKKR